MCENENGYASEKFEYDEVGNLNKRGVACSKAVYGNDNKLQERSFFNIDGNLVINSTSGYAILRNSSCLS